MQKIIAALLLTLLIFLSSAEADTINFEWDKVTTDVAGLPVQELQGYKFYISQTPGTYGAPIATIVPAPTGTVEKYSYTQNTKGTYYATVTAFNTGGESARSNEVTFSIAVKLPGVPFGLKFTKVP